MVLVDTDVLIKCLQAEPEFMQEVTELLEAKSAIITPIQTAEVYGNTIPEEVPAVNAFLQLFEFVEFDPKIAEQAGEFLHQYKPYYETLTVSDCLIGATAAHYEAEIYTLHPKHFPMTEVRLYHKTIKAITAKTKPRLGN